MSIDPWLHEVRVCIWCGSPGCDLECPTPDDYDEPGLDETVPESWAVA